MALKVLSAPNAKAIPKAKATPTASKLVCTLKEILDEFKISDQVQFDLFKPEARTKARANISSFFLS